MARLAVDTSTGNHRPGQPQLPVELVEHDAGLHDAGAVDLVDLDQLLQVLAEIDHQRTADRLAGLRGAAAARQQRHALLARNRQRRAHVVVGARHHHAQRLDLVVRRVRGVAPAREAVEQHLALQLAAQALGEPMGDGICFGDYSHFSVLPVRRIARKWARPASQSATLRVLAIRLTAGRLLHTIQDVPAQWGVGRKMRMIELD